MIELEHRPLMDADEKETPKLSANIGTDSAWTDTAAIYIHFEVEYSIYEHFGKDEARTRAWVES